MSLIPKKGTVYVVDDDEAVRDSLQWLLEGKDYRVRCFESAEAFLARFDPREVACLIVDVRMGGMTGLELQDRLIEQVLINLMKNAAESIDHADRPVDRRHVELRVVPRRQEDEDVVEFSVTDTGKGLPPQTLERLYEAFFSTKAEGMGIGLNLCRSIIESHAGRIEAQNLYNADEIVGCRFSFWIPVHAAALPEKPSEVSP